MLTLFEAGDLHPRIAYVLYGKPAYASPEASTCAGQFRKSPLRVVKQRRTHSEQMSSGFPLKADIAQCSRHVSKVPKGDSCSAANSIIIRSPRRRGPRRRAGR
jgi:hypothetical protein